MLRNDHAAVVSVERQRTGCKVNVGDWSKQFLSAFLGYNSILIFQMWPYGDRLMDLMTEYWQLSRVQMLICQMPLQDA